MIPIGNQTAAVPIIGIIEKKNISVAQMRGDDTPTTANNMPPMMLWRNPITIVPFIVARVIDTNFLMRSSSCSS